MAALTSHSDIHAAPKAYSIEIGTVVNGWIVTFQTNSLRKSVVIQSTGQNRVEELMFGIESVLAELEGAVQ